MNAPTIQTTYHECSYNANNFKNASRILQLKKTTLCECSNNKDNTS
jgi:hypothetical protein